MNTRLARLTKRLRTSAEALTTNRALVAFAILLAACAPATPPPEPSPLPTRVVRNGPPAASPTTVPTPVPTAAPTSRPASAATGTPAPSSSATPAQATPIASPAVSPVPSASPAASATPVVPFLPAFGPVLGDGTGPSPVTRLRIPRIGIDSAVITLGVEKDGIMQSPDRPEVTAWYNFSVIPGSTGNALFSGHLDWRTGVTGVFWRLKEIQPGDPIYVRTVDGVEQQFVVEWAENFDDRAAPLGKVLGPTRDPAITLITCEGTFDPATRNYDGRRVVRAIKL